MIRRSARIVNKFGLHARPAAMLVTAAARYQSEVFFVRDALRVNGKSIMGVMMLAAEKGTELMIEVEGPDEERAIVELLRVVESGFGENE
ncbi:MAG TPA: HPr family phosphocarrier protein [Candidatus Deferrimicrobium sp.]|nr:HPr family phosphocarrier protein [Candidatus Deferrimicrobium sp.]